jgi:hypothetical protein
MIYTRTEQGFIGWQEGSEALTALQAVPEERRPEFFAESHPEVSEWLMLTGSQAAADAVRAMCSRLRERIAKASHYLQASRWPVQLAAAQDVTTNGEAASALNKQMLDTEARLRARGETREQLAAKVLANSGVFTLVGAVIDGIETATLDAIADYTGTDPNAYAAITDQARLDAQVELVAVYTPAVGLANAEALVAQIVGA